MALFNITMIKYIFNSLHFFIKSKIFIGQGLGEEEEVLRGRPPMRVRGRGRTIRGRSGEKENLYL